MAAIGAIFQTRTSIGASASIIASAADSNIVDVTLSLDGTTGE